MAELLLSGAIFGFLLGACHAYLIIQTRRDLIGAKPTSAIWPAFGALVLWTLFGPYVLIMSIGAAIWFSVLQVRGKTIRI